MQTAEKRKKILWLVSWYPNKTDYYTGDFIQRHAQAASLQNDIHVLYVRDVQNMEISGETSTIENGLTEQIIYYRVAEGKRSILAKHYNWFKVHLNAIEKYIQANGKPDVVHVHVPWKAGLIALWVKKKYNIAYAVTEHWGMYNGVVEDNFFRKPLIVQLLIKQTFKRSDHFVSVSRFLASSIQHWMKNTPVTVVPNVVNTTFFQYTVQKHRKFTFIHVSTMAPLKNVPGLLRSFKQFLEGLSEGACQLILIGNKGNEYPSLAASIGLEKSVIFKGEIPYQQVAEEMKQAHCLVLNSFIENAPCVIGEAHCCGLPVIATEVGGIPEMINRSNGLLVAPDDESALSKAFLNIFKNYNSFNGELIAQEAAKKYGYTTIATQFDLVYTHLAGAAQ